MSSQLGVDDPAFYETLTPFDAEFCRRTWWTICRHENSQAEAALQGRQPMIVQTTIPQPGNYNDDDLTPSMEELPTPRRGITQMSYVLLNFRLVQIGTSLLGISRQRSQDYRREYSKAPDNAFTRCQENLNYEITRYCDPTRPLDRLILLTAKVTLVSRVVVKY